MKQKAKEERLAVRVEQWVKATTRRDPVDPRAYHKPGSMKK